MVKTLWKSIWSFLRKLELDLPEDPSILLLSICVALPQDYVLHYVHIILICDIQKPLTTQMPQIRRLNTENMVHLYNGILPSYLKGTI